MFLYIEINWYEEGQEKFKRYENLNISCMK